MQNNKLFLQNLIIHFLEQHNDTTLHYITLFTREDPGPSRNKQSTMGYVTVEIKRNLAQRKIG